LISQNLVYRFDRPRWAYPNRIALWSTFPDVAGLSLDSVIFVVTAFTGTGLPSPDPPKMSAA